MTVLFVLSGIGIKFLRNMEVILVTGMKFSISKNFLNTPGHIDNIKYTIDIKH